MPTIYKKIWTIILLLSAIYTKAQTGIDWGKIELVGAEAKVLNVSAGSGLIIKTFEVTEGIVSVYLPPLTPGATISGTVYTEPKGKDEKEKTKNLASLQAYLVTLGPENIPIQGNSFSIPVTAAIPRVNTLPLNISTAAGQLIKSEPLPVSTITPINTTIIPNYAVIGDASMVTGNFDGKLSTTSLKVNGQPVQILAESPSAIYFNPSQSTPGRTTIEVTDNGKTQTGSINVLKLDLSAPKTNLRRGEKTTISINVTGLEGIKTNVPVNIQNTSPSVVTLEGGNTQQIIIDPAKDVSGGSFQTTRSVQSLKTGSYSVTVTIPPASAQK